MEEMVKLAAVSLAMVIMFQLVKDGSGSIAFAFYAICAFVVLAFVIRTGGVLFTEVKRLTLLGGISSGLLTPMLKVLGITLCSRITAELCRDGGNRALATQVELFAVLASVICMLPLFEEVLNLIGSL